MSKSLYFIAISPTHRIQQDIHALKHWISQKYQSKASLRLNAHITLQMPFQLASKKEALFLSEFDNFCRNQKPFDIELNGFGIFEPRVVFVDVKDNQQLESLQKEVASFMKKHQVFNSTHKNNGFHPHITVAYRDLKKPAFYQLWKELKDRSLEEKFTVESITVFKHNGKKWDVLKELKLNLDT